MTFADFLQAHYASLWWLVFCALMAYFAKD